MKSDIWQGCYDEGWGKSIVPEAYSHPAKFSRGLIHRIYEHAKKMGWFKPGDYCLDPFAGVSLGAVDAISMGLNWVGVELEEKFVKLGEQNIELWNRQLAGWPKLGTARIIKGDSRRLREVIREAGLIISSPPYSGARIGGIDSMRRSNDSDGDYGDTPGQLGTLPEGNFQDVIEKADLVVSSPPYAESNQNYKDGFSRIKTNRDYSKEIADTASYGQTPGNLANLKEGEFEMVVGSPPYVEIATGAGGLNIKPPKNPLQQSGRNPKSASQDTNQHYGHTPGNLANLKEGEFQMVVGSPPFMTETEGKGLNVNKPKSFRGVLKNGSMSMGQSPGQLGAMKEGSIDLVCSSPPYEAIVKGGGGRIDFSKTKRDGDTRHQSPHSQGKVPFEYSKSSNNLGNSCGDTFWQASKIILQQCYELLKPGGHAIWVCKDYIKAKKRVPFSNRWLALCESVGFKLVCRHKAMLVKEVGQQVHIRGKHRLKKEKKSFFRRNIETKNKANEFWHTISLDDQNYYMERATKVVPDYSKLSRLIEKAQVLAFKEMCLDDSNFEDDRIIQWEDVLCLSKLES